MNFVAEPKNLFLITGDHQAGSRREYMVLGWTTGPNVGQFVPVVADENTAIPYTLNHDDLAQAFLVSSPTAIYQVTDDDEPPQWAFDRIGEHRWGFG
jgi:hypothetical protein